MGSGIAGSCNISINIDGVDIPFSRRDTFLSVMNVNVSLPAIRFSLLDPTSIFSKNLPLNDGSLLKISIGDDRNPPREAIYRTFGTPQRKPGSDAIASFGVHAILDAIPYIRNNPLRAIQGAASTAMQTVAQESGFTLNNNVITNDLMQWLPGRKTWNGFAEMLARHGWADETSALHIGVDMAKTLHFHDITQLFIKGDIKKTLFYGKPPTKVQAPLLAVDEYKAENHSGVQNQTFGYGLRMPQTDLIAGTIKKLSNVKAMSVSNLIDMSTDVLKSVGERGRIDIPRISVGNSHPQYIAAQHQNARLKSTYSQVVDVLCSSNTGLTLFDMVQFSVVNDTYSDESVSGLYCVTGISSAIKNHQYKEKLQLTSSGPQNDSKALV